MDEHLRREIIRSLHTQFAMPHGYIGDLAMGYLVAQGHGRLVHSHNYMPPAEHVGAPRPSFKEKKHG